ncbi:hemerythrin domain-containing protein [Novosphingobium bradum]|uniref:Hemerythrin domain-containing protein n=1 Tax=Novosphingobium bradum TaxID=1737444 RepID=A0ABV7IL77_9SPHN
MSIFDKLASALLPPESAQDRANARQVAQTFAGDGDWLAIILEQHRQVEAFFTQAMVAPDGPSRTAALKRLGVLLTGHAIAEESVIYPAIADSEKGHAATAYHEQAAAKVELAHLERLDPMGKDWREKLEQIQRAVLHHVFEEEGTWFPELQQRLAGAERTRLTRRFMEEFERYTRGPSQHLAPMQMAAQQSGPGSAPMGK